MELKEIVTLYRRWIWLLIAGLAIGLASGFAVTKIQKPVYEATTQVLVARNRQQGGADILSLSDQQLVTTYQQLLKTQPVLHEVASRLGVEVNPDNIQVGVVLNTQILKIQVSDGDSSRAASIANTMVQVLIEQNETLQAGRYATYEQGLNNQIAQVQQQTADLQNQITRLDQANIEEQLALVSKQITSLQDQILALEKQIAQSPEAITSIQRATLAERQAQLDQLRSLLLQYQEIQTNLTYIGKPVQAGGALTDPQVASLQSTLNLYQQLYLNLLNNLEAVKLARVQSTPTVTQIEQAIPPKTPIRPLPLLYTALGGMVGLLLAAAAVLLIDYFDDSFKAARQVEALLEAPVIGQLSETPMDRGRFSRRGRNGHKELLLENAFGALRINLGRLMAGKAQKSILVTSACRAEGKTTVAARLARSFAQSGKKVVLVDADFRHPQIHTHFGLENQVGLADILAIGMDWQEASCTAEGVTVITGGTPSMAQSGLLESDNMTGLLEKLQRKADIVILDGPPLFLVSAQALAAKVGGILVVVRQGETKTSAARALKDQLQLMDVPLMAAVLNRVKRTDEYYYDGYMAEILEQAPVETGGGAEAAQN